MLLIPETKQASEVKFYTLNRKSTKKTNSVDPYSRLVHNIEVDSRLRKDGSNITPSNGHDVENRRSYSFEVRPQVPSAGSRLGAGFHSTSDIQSSSSGGRMNGGVVKQDRHLARAVLSQRIRAAEEKEKRMSKEINASPVSTRGEVTTTISTKDTENKRWSTNSPSAPKPLPDHLNAPFNKAGSAPPRLPPEGEVASAPIFKAQGTKQLDTVGRQNKRSSGLAAASEQTPLLGREDSVESSGDLYSPGGEDFTFVPIGGVASLRGSGKRPVSSSSSSTRSSNGSNQNYDHLEEFVGGNKIKKRPDSWESFSNSNSESPSPITITTITTTSDENLPLTASGDHASSRLSNGSSSNESGVYDHLPVLPPGSEEEEEGVASLPPLPSQTLELPPVHRNISAPALSHSQTSSSARASPSDQFAQFGSIDEESSDEELEVTPTNSDEEGEKKPAPGGGVGVVETRTLGHPGVVMRPKKKQVEDPFADLLSPKSSARLRWSQELNPLYDYVRGFKADGVRLYDSSPASKLLQSTTAASLEGGGAGGGAPSNKPPSVIIEDEGEHERAYSAVSEDTQSVCSQDTVQSPTSPSSSVGDLEGEGSLGEAITTMPRVSTTTLVGKG